MMNSEIRPGARWWTAGTLVVIGALSVVGCAEEIRSDPADGAEEARPTVSVSTPVVDASPGFETNLYSEHDADVYSRLMIEETAAGGIPITAIHVEVGDRVKAGQSLASLDNSDARLYVKAAEPKAALAAATLRRVEELHKTGVVSPSEYDEALFDSRLADAELEQAQLTLSRTVIRAPFSGVVARRYVKVGEIVDDETPLFRITAMSPLRARLLVPESDAGSFAVGTPVSVRSADGTEGRASVIIVSPTVDPGSGTREVVVELTERDGFRPGASVRVSPVTEAEMAGP